MSKPPLMPTTAPASGIVHDPLTQQRVIPESRRADGSIRKERKVKPGFTPAEDVTKFRSSRMQEAERRKLPPGSIVGYTKPQPPPPAAPKAAQPKKPAPAPAHTPDAWDDDDAQPAHASTSGTNGTGKPAAAAPLRALHSEKAKEKPASTAEPEPAPAQDPAKRARALQKKLRAAESLRAKQEAGEALLPEQTAKVDEIDAMLKELEQLKVGEDNAGEGDRKKGKAPAG